MLGMDMILMGIAPCENCVPDGNFAAKYTPIFEVLYFKLRVFCVIVGGDQD
jgi:hypothetical protein